MIDPDEVFKVSHAMEKYGGSFVKHLGMALHYADHINAQKIKNTWPDYWKEYLEMGGID